jgi:hypothetical protein
MKTKLLSIALMISSLSYAQDLTGAWQSGPEENRTVMIVSAKHFAVTVYNLKDKTFAGTYGGSWRIEKDLFVALQEFNTLTPAQVGTEVRLAIRLNKEKLTMGDSEFVRLDNGTPGALAGAWLITGRVTDKGQQTITPGARKTMKILSGTRFQWIAYNSETKEFFGTGGGTYTTVDGRYAETIEFFSRDNTRVGMTLEFNFSLPEGNWRHSGKSSKGDPIDEIWTKREKIGI